MRLTPILALGRGLLPHTIIACLACGPGTMPEAEEASDTTDIDTFGTEASSGTTAGLDGSSCAPPDPGLTPVSEGQAASTQAAHACTAFADCKCDARGWRPVPSCRHSMNMDYELLQERAQTAGLQYDGRCLAQAVAELQALGCEQADPAIHGSILGPGRCAIYHGDRALGETCTDVGGGMSDCAQGLACWAGECIDACAQTEAGPRCGDPYNFACPPGTVCSGWACAQPPDAEPLPDVGEGCYGTCTSGAWCEIESCREDCWGTCRALLESGAVCTDDSQCISQFCAAGTCRDDGLTGDSCVDGRCAEGRECLDGTCGPPEGSICTPQS